MVRKRFLIGLLAVLVVAGVVVGWVLSSTTLETVSPEEARSDPVARAQRASSEVDCSRAKCIALTFDGGPGPHTARLLDVLKEKKVPATFFLLGRKHIERRPELVRRIAREGHEVASHTWTHPRLTEVSSARVRRELGRTQRALEKLTGRPPRLIRPPQGRTDDRVSEICRKYGLAQVLWSVTAKDYATNDSALIRKRTLKGADRDGILLLHDIYKGTVPAVPGVIDGLKRRGYTFVTVPQLMAPGRAEPGKVYR
jgi:peptidoglycan/xylan/chitin deacetylase (PgdA/CDA1 family)